MSRAATDPSLAERLCIDGIAAVELYGEGFAIDEMAEADTLEGVVLYAQLLEATLMTLYAAGQSPTTPAAIREAARATASAWRGRRPTPPKENPHG